MSRNLRLILAVLAAALPAPVLAQTQTVIVPGGSGVVIGPRSHAAPRSTLAPPARPQQRFVVATPQGDPLTGPTAAAAIGLAGAAALAVILGGGSGGGSSGGGSATAATSRTR
jgi:hypothetical protein